MIFQSRAPRTKLLIIYGCPLSGRLQNSPYFCVSSSTHEQSSKRSGTRLKTVSETGSFFSRLTLGHTLPFLLILRRKKNDCLQFSRAGFHCSCMLVSSMRITSDSFYLLVSKFEKLPMFANNIFPGPLLHTCTCPALSRSGQPVSGGRGGGGGELERTLERKLASLI